MILDINVSGHFAFFFLCFTTVFPAILAVRLAAQQNRSKLVSSIITFVLGFTLIGGWLYLGLLNLLSPRSTAQ